MEWRGPLSDHDFFIRAAEAEQAGLFTGLGFPLRERGERVGVILFLGRRIAPPDEDLEALLTELGAHVGQAIALENARRATHDADQAIEALFEALPVGLVLLDAFGRTLRANAALGRALDVSPADLEALDVVAFVHPDEQDAAASRLHELLDGRRSEGRLASRFVRSNGDVLAVSGMARALPRREGVPPRVLIMLDERAGP